MQEVHERQLMQIKLVIHLTLTFNHLYQRNHGREERKQFAAFSLHPAESPW